MTPTRCELHSLLVGLQHSGDAALQICDNTKAIGLVVLARSLKRRGGLPRYSNIYRVELRSLMALFTDNGTFTGDWTRAHQDPDDTTDPTIRTKRLLLAEADSLATLAHQLLPLTNYAHLIIPDSWEQRDEQDRPVTGATAPWLGAVYGRRDWPKVQARKPDTVSHSDSPPGTSVNRTPLPSTSTGAPYAILYTPTPENTAYNHAGRPTAARAPISLTRRNTDSASQLPPAPRPSHYTNTSFSLHKRSFHKAGYQTKTYTFLDMARP
ncbi:hypothetical protein DYB28_015992 [Aphanomyces astaci]|uniref:Uncharacterized protein n=1 Tax=Aphanomyces astaci TaxID=112090 RepID=A0A9X8DNZ9_APHAT|nr:hypothetical protein DYB28_015992 [Aphanomyces astaci]